MRPECDVLHPLKQSDWATITQNKTGVLLWLQDLSTSNKYQMELSKKIQDTWDAFEAKGEEFTMQHCMSITLEHWNRVSEVEMTMSKPQDKPTDPTDNSGDL